MAPSPSESIGSEVLDSHSLTTLLARSGDRVGAIPNYWPHLDYYKHAWRGANGKKKDFEWNLMPCYAHST